MMKLLFKNHLLLLILGVCVFSSCKREDITPKVVDEFFSTDETPITDVETPVEYTTEEPEEEIFPGDIRQGISTHHAITVDHPYTDSDENFPADMCLDSTIDHEGNHICVGSTTRNLGDDHAGGGDIFVMKTNPEGKFFLPFSWEVILLEGFP